jgi:hypothetical protein
MKRKPRTVRSPTDPMAALLRDARPERAVFVVVKGRDYELYECAVPDLKALDGVISQGFDPRGVCGPTYWRYTASHYYSTMLTQKGIVLVITKFSWVTTH